jgi:hypothetical protein
MANKSKKQLLLAANKTLNVTLGAYHDVVKAFRKVVGSKSVTAQNTNDERFTNKIVKLRGLVSSLETTVSNIGDLQYNELNDAEKKAQLDAAKKRAAKDAAKIDRDVKKKEQERLKAEKKAAKPAKKVEKAKAKADKAQVKFDKIVDKKGAPNGNVTKPHPKVAKAAKVLMAANANLDKLTQKATKKVIPAPSQAVAAFPFPAEKPIPKGTKAKKVKTLTKPSGAKPISVGEMAAQHDPF